MIAVSPLELKNIVQKLNTAYGVQAMNQTNNIVQAIFARINSISIYNIVEKSFNIQTHVDKTKSLKIKKVRKVWLKRLPTLL